MLDRVRSIIDAASESDTDFRTEYKHFIMSVQDSNIDREVMLNLRSNRFDIKRIGKMIVDTQESLARILR